MSDRPMSDHCPTAIRDDLKAYLDHELTPIARLRVWRHLKTCADCAQELTMLQETQGRLKTALPDEAPPEDLRGRIRAQINAAGLTDERIRRNQGRSGLIPGRWIPLAATVSIVVTVVCLYAIIAPIRERARQAAARSSGKQVGLALLQYYQDYDETFPASKTTKPPKSSMGWQTYPNYGPSAPLVIEVRSAHPDAALNALCQTDFDSVLQPDGDGITVIAMPPREIARLALDLQKIGTPNLAQVHRAQRIARKRPGATLSITIHILPEATR